MLTSVLELKILFQISLTEKWHFGAKGIWANHLTFPSPTIPFGRDTQFLIPFFVQQNAGHRVRGADLHSSIILMVSLSARWFKHRRVGELTSPSLSLWQTTLQLINFNCMSICLRLFLCLKVILCSLDIHIYIFMDFLHMFLSNMNNFLNRFISLIDRTLTGTITSGSVDPGVMAMKGYSTTFQFLKWKQIQDSLIHVKKLNFFFFFFFFFYFFVQPAF